MALSGDQFSIADGSHEAMVVEVGAGLRRYAVDGVDVTFPYAEDELSPKGCGATLVPWPNRLRGGHYTFAGVEYQVPITEPARGNANHGLARWARWTPVAHTADAVTLRQDLVPQTGWPFEIRVEVTYSIAAATGLAVTIVASNTGSGPAPFGAGFHPYLSVHGHPLDEVAVQVPAARHLLNDDAQIPVGDEPVDGSRFDLRAGQVLGAGRLDDAFTGLAVTDGRGAAEVRTPSGGARVWFDEAFGYLQVFTVDDVAHGRPGVAIEPMSCPADAFNSGAGLIVLEPGRTWRASWGIQPLPG